MKAVKYGRYGTADVIQIQEVAQPAPRDNEVLVRIHETIVTPPDIASRSGQPFMIRFFSGLTRPNAIAGTDFAGEVVAVGQGVTTFRPGDRVFGAANAGAHAEFICVSEDGVVTTLSDNLTYRDVAGVCDGGMTALTFLRDIAKIRPGQAILINGASGSVGQFAVQLAKHFGADVTGVCSGKNVALVASLGADEVIDYTRTDFAQTGATYDVIFDAVGKRTYADCERALKPGGLYMTTVPSLNILLQMARTSLTGKKKALFSATGLSMNREKLDYLRALLESGQLRNVIDRCYPLAEIAAAHRYVESGHKRGAVVVTIVPSPAADKAEARAGTALMAT